jgi:C4-type Zn-finger protein
MQEIREVRCPKCAKLFYKVIETAEHEVGAERIIIETKCHRCGYLHREMIIDSKPKII